MKAAWIAAMGVLLSALPGSAGPGCRALPPEPMRASEHGFAFVNSFEWTPPGGWARLPFRHRYGLCGGMSFYAMDRFHAGVAPPSASVTPGPGDPLFERILLRQADTMGFLGRRTLRYLAWMALPEEGEGGSQAATARAFGEMLPDLERGEPVALALIYVGFADRGAIWHNHQVVATGVDYSGRGVYTVSLYDPNFPGNGSVSLVLRPSADGYETTQWIGQHRRRHVRGFFRTPYLPSDVK
ncbi:MAG: hypothetical protein EA423_12735 [Phycisphaerales bacterium]|nr:MAG: hypothetical protein EA423_12735 [Phycisphaerales bacterium]